jgi:hypothetical protein
MQYSSPQRTIPRKTGFHFAESNSTLPIPLSGWQHENSQT